MDFTKLIQRFKGYSIIHVVWSCVAHLYPVYSGDCTSTHPVWDDTHWLVPSDMIQDTASQKEHNFPINNQMTK